MVRCTGLTAKGRPVADRDTASKANLSGYDTVAAYDDIVGNLNHIIDLGVLTNHRVLKGTAVDAGPRPDGDAVLNNDPAKLRHIHRPFCRPRYAKARLAKARSREDANMIADHGKADGDIGTDLAVPTNRDPRPDGCGGTNIGSHTNRGPRAKAACGVGVIRTAQPLGAKACWLAERKQALAPVA